MACCGRPPTMLGVSLMLLSPNWPAGPVPRHCRTGCHQHTGSATHWHGSLGMNSMRCPVRYLWLSDEVSQSWLARGPAHMWQSEAGGQGRASPEQACPLLTVPLAALASASPQVPWCHWPPPVLLDPLRVLSSAPSRQSWTKNELLRAKNIRVWAVALGVLCLQGVQGQPDRDLSVPCQGLSSSTRQLNLTQCGKQCRWHLLGGA